MSSPDSTLFPMQLVKPIRLACDRDALELGFVSSRPSIHVHPMTSTQPPAFSLHSHFRFSDSPIKALQNETGWFDLFIAFNASILNLSLFMHITITFTQANLPAGTRLQYIRNVLAKTLEFSSFPLCHQCLSHPQLNPNWLLLPREHLSFTCSAVITIKLKL